MKEREPLIEEITEKISSFTVHSKVLLLSAVIIVALMCGFISIMVWGVILPSLPKYPTNEKETMNYTCGNGNYYPDSLACECQQCWMGENCDIQTPDCVINPGSGQPWLFQEYWIQRREEKPKVTIDFGYRVAYDYSWRRPMDENYNVGIGGALNQEIRKLHRIYGNYNTTGKYLLISNGATSFMSAFISAVSVIRGNTPQKFYVSTPYYYGYPSRCKVGNCTWSTDNNLDPSNVVEAVTEPNNPSGYPREPFYTTNPYWFNDLVYYWPHLGGFGYNIPMKNSDTAFFSFTKLTGHAATRIGWAFVKDQQLATVMMDWLFTCMLQCSIQSMGFGLQVFKEISNNGNEFFDWANGRLQERWTQLIQILGNQENIVLRSKVGTQYGWLEVVGKNDTEVRDMCLNVGISPPQGGRFGQPGHIRLNLCEANVTFQRILMALQSLVTNFKTIEKLPAPTNINTFEMDIYI